MNLYEAYLVAMSAKKVRWRVRKPLCALPFVPALRTIGAGGVSVLIVLLLSTRMSAHGAKAEVGLLGREYRF